MNDLRTRARLTIHRRRVRPGPLVDVVAAALVAVGVTAWATQAPGRAPDLSIENPTPYDVTITVGGAAGTHSTPLAIVNAGSQVTVASPLDEGPVWVFHFGPAGDYRIDRAALRQNGWHLRVPDSVATQMAAAGVSPSPNR